MSGSGMDGGMGMSGTDGGDVVYVAVTGHPMRVTHTDGYPVQPVSTSLLRLGMGERYDAIITVTDGVFRWWPSTPRPE